VHPYSTTVVLTSIILRRGGAASASLPLQAVSGVVGTGGTGVGVGVKATCALLKDGTLDMGWVDAKTGDPVDDNKDVRGKCEMAIMSHAGLRLRKSNEPGSNIGGMMSLAQILKIIGTRQ